jgi:hypothetical protein
MLQKFKITSYAIIVALAAVLVLPVNAAELQLVSPTGIQVAQINKVPAHMMQESDTFQSLDREAVDAIANTRKRQVEERSRECTIALEKFLSTFEGMYAAQATEKVRRVHESNQLFTTQEYWREALCARGFSEESACHLRIDRAVAMGLVRNEGGRCGGGPVNYAQCIDMFARDYVLVEPYRLQVQHDAETTTQVVNMVVNSMSGKAYEAIDHMLAAVTKFRNSAGGDSCGLKPMIKIDK